MLERMREENKEMKRLLHRLLARSTQEEQEIRLPENINLPVSSVEEMDALDETLMNQTQMMAMVGQYIIIFTIPDYCKDRMFFMEVNSNILTFNIFNKW